MFFKETVLLAVMFMFVSCASMNEKVPGYSAQEIKAQDKELMGKNRDQVIAILGKPIAEGLCYSGSQIGSGQESYMLIYRKEDSVRYKHALDMSSEKYTLKCTIVDLNKKIDGEYTYSGINVMDQTSCNRDYGIVARVRNPKKCKQIYQ